MLRKSTTSTGLRQNRGLTQLTSFVCCGHNVSERGNHVAQHIAVGGEQRVALLALFDAAKDGLSGFLLELAGALELIAVVLFAQLFRRLKW